MTVWVANTQIRSADDLSDLGRLVLAFIDGGTEWLAWAKDDASAQFRFADEAALVAGVQEGLHESRLALLPRLGLVIGPVKLMALTVDELRVLARVEGGQGDTRLSSDLDALLARQCLVRQADIDLGTALLHEIGVSNAPIFQVLGLEDRLAIYGLTNPPSGTEDGADAPAQGLREEAGRFAVEQGRTPLEFVDYYRAYLRLSATPGAATDAAGRRSYADSALGTLLPLLFGVLECPQIGGGVAPSSIAAAAYRWLSGGKRLGFARLSSALLQVVENTAFTGETGEAARSIVDQYVADSHAFLTATTQALSTTVGSKPLELLGQDGISRVLLLSAGEWQAELCLSPAGMITQRGHRLIQGMCPQDKYKISEGVQSS